MVYAVDVHCDLAKCYRLEADSLKDAEKKVWKIVWKMLAQPTPAALDSLVEAGFEPTDDVEVACSGMGETEDEIEYF